MTLAWVALTLVVLVAWLMRQHRKVYDPCWRCAGTGRDRQPPWADPCETCRGRGQILAKLHRAKRRR